MLKKTLFCLSVAAALCRCGLRQDETIKLRAQIDSLKSEIRTNQEIVMALEEIGMLIDSIDDSRSALKTRMSKGTTFGDFTTRLRDIDQYIQEAQHKITSLESGITSQKNFLTRYSAIITKLKHDLDAMNRDLAIVQDRVNTYRNQNENLVQTASLQREEIEDKLTQVETKQGEIETLQTQIKELLTQSKSDEADAYFARAKAVEEQANRTRFAPRKKKETRKEALELYKLAASYGKEEAKLKITELESQI